MQHLSKLFVIALSVLQILPVLAEEAASGSGVELGAKKTKEVFLVQDVPQTLMFDYEIGEIAVGQPNIVAIVADRPRRRIVLSPLAPGDTALLVFDTFGKQRDNIQITVTSTDLDQFTRDLKFLFRDIEGLQFRRVGRKVVIEGEVYLKSDLDRIREVLTGNDFVVNLVTLSQDTQRILARRIKDEISIAGVEVGTVKDRIVLKGEVATEDEQKRAERIANIYVDEKSIVNVISINPKKASAKAGRLIQVTAYFVELNKSFFRNFNFTFAPTAAVNFQYAYQPTTGFQPFFQAALSRFLPSLDTAKALGVARVFENPTVSVKSGENASISSGGQIYVPRRNDQGDIAFSPFDVGVKMNVTPAADERDFIDLQVGIEVSKLGSAKAESAISVNKSEISTKHYIRSGETVALGGVLRSAFTDLKDAPPNTFAFQPAGPEGPRFDSAFGNLFQIFKSRQSNSDRTMFIVFITPEILVSGRDASKNLKEEMNLQSVEPRSQAGDTLE